MSIHLPKTLRTSQNIVWLFTNKHFNLLEMAKALEADGENKQTLKKHVPKCNFPQHLSMSPIIVNVSLHTEEQKVFGDD